MVSLLPSMDIWGQIAGNFIAFGVVILIIVVSIAAKVLDGLTAGFAARIAAIAIGLVGGALMMFSYGGMVGMILAAAFIIFGAITAIGWAPLFHKGFKIPGCCCCKGLGLSHPEANCCLLTTIVFLFIYFVFPIGTIIGIVVLLIIVIILSIFTGGALEEAVPAAMEEGQMAEVVKGGEGGGGGISDIVGKLGKGGGAPSAPAQAPAAAPAPSPAMNEMSEQALKTQQQAMSTELEMEAKLAEAEAGEGGKPKHKLFHKDTFGRMKGMMQNSMKDMQKMQEDYTDKLTKSTGGKSVKHKKLRRIGEIALACGIIYIVMIFLTAAFPTIGTTWGLKFMPGIEFIGSAAASGWDATKEGAYTAWNKFVPRELLGVPIVNPLKYESCYPFCMTPTGKDTKWHGLEVTELDMYPTQIYDYQRPSIRTEISNLGSQSAIFLPPQYPMLGFVEECEWDFASGFGSLDPEQARVCSEKYPFLGDPDQDWNAVATGSKDCTGIGGALSIQPCNIDAGEVLRINWYGIKINGSNNILDIGDVLRPEITMNITYTYHLQTDLVGELVVLSPETQITAAETKALGRITNKISESYSPTGPLMMALGTAEETVVQGVPTFFMVQFANKGKGLMEVVPAGDIKLYVRPEFTVRTDNGKVVACDFEKIGFVDELGNEIWTGLPSIPDEWKPYAPGAWDIYEAKNSIGPLEKSSNPAENPGKGCLFDTSDTTPDLQTYTFKVRVRTYNYTETQSTKVSIIGTETEIIE